MNLKELKDEVRKMKKASCPPVSKMKKGDLEKEYERLKGHVKPDMNALVSEAKEHVFQHAEHQKKPKALSEFLKKKNVEVEVKKEVKKEVKVEVKSGNKWLEHVAQFRKAHPGLSGKQVLIEAKKTYK